MRTLLAVLTLLLPLVASATLQVEPSSRIVEENATLRLQIRLSGSSPDEALDLTPLQADFEIIGQQMSSKLSIINGHAESSTEWTLTLRPRRSGKLVIPSLEADGERSSPVDIEVRPLDPAIRDRIAQQVFFETLISPDHVYVQAQMTVTRRLHYAEGVQLYGELPDEPTIPGAIVQRLADATHRNEMRGGARYGIIEQTFAVFPERSGPLVIPAAALTASVTFTDASGRRRRTESRATSEAVTVEVLPIPAEYPATEPWLPAHRIEILEDWPDGNVPLEVGHPRERAILVRAEGAMASMIPPLAMPYSEAVKTYPDQPQLQDLRSPSGIVGVRTEVTSLVPVRPGSLQLPGATLTWWDTAAAAVRVAALSPRIESVVGSAAPDATLDPSPPLMTTEPPAADATPSTESQQVPSEVTVPPMQPNRAALISTVTLLLIGSMSAWLWRRQRGRTAAPRNREPRAYRDLRSACRRGEPHAIRRALDTWLRCRYDSSIEAALARFANDPDARRGIDELNARLYGASDAYTRSEDLLRAVRSARRTPKRGQDPLPSLYPSPGVRQDS